MHCFLGWSNANRGVFRRRLPKLASSRQSSGGCLQYYLCNWSGTKNLYLFFLHGYRYATFARLLSLIRSGRKLFKYGDSFYDLRGYSHGRSSILAPVFSSDSDSVIRVAVVQLVILVGEYLLSIYPLWTSKPAILTIIPLNPRSLFRGKYVYLDYDIAHLNERVIGQMPY